MDDSQDDGLLWRECKRVFISFFGGIFLFLAEGGIVAILALVGLYRQSEIAFKVLMFPLFLILQTASKDIEGKPDILGVVAAIMVQALFCMLIVYGFFIWAKIPELPKERITSIDLN